ncbi:cell wall metabolism sensor histidine kinase WalK [Streptomyces sp. FIT100]|uniref:sensor histidine kinase n=1 Tax=Streptomyces sp. FIT100 TaxID=2837956 RepID=UPI0021C76E55|nr:HAMP domain-containing sensor histidine kinase [Streptomyces sp. FIT100]UUN28740.1 HAMP domain-containing histidine kinase [Streptomyces sp. FIT100]
MRLPRHRTHSLRAKLTLVNVVLLALGIAIATGVSLFGLRHYLLDAIDRELTASRQGLERAALTLHEVESLSALASIRDKLLPEYAGAGTLPRPETIFVAVGPEGRPVTFGGMAPTERQRELAAAAGDPHALARSDAIDTLRLDGDPYRAVGASLGDGTTVLMATSTKAVHQSMGRALKVDFAFGGLLLALLAAATLMGARRTLRPLEDMVETASAIAEGDLTRRVPGRHDPVTEIEQLRLALNSMLQQVESAYVTRERSAAQLRRFVADASHELRTPLSAIRGYLHLLDKGMLGEPAERDRALSRMTAEADRMSRLVDELLTLARLDQRPRLRLRPVDLSRLVRDAAEDLAAQQPRRPLTVRAAGAMVVQGDEQGLRQVVGNLLANVRCHTEESAPVRVELSRSAEGEVRLTVADAGPGMRQEDADRIFDRFFRADGAGAGTGLGMSIVQAVAESHAGTVTATGTPGGQGLTVTVTLPPRRGDEPAAGGPTALQSAHDGRATRETARPTTSKHGG